MSEIKQINTGVADIIAVKVPNGIIGWAIGNGCIYFNSVGVKLIPYGDYEPLGLSTEIEEDVLFDLMPDYVDFYGSLFFGTEELHFDTAKESFASLMQANGCYSVNPYGKKAPKYDVSKSDGSATRYLEWKKAEANTGTWLILKRLS